MAAVGLQDRLLGKSVLIIGCSSGPKSMEILRSCRNTGAVLYIATCPRHYETVYALLQKEELYIQQGIHFLIVPSMTRPTEYTREQIISDIVDSVKAIPTIVKTKDDFPGLDACVTFQEVYVDYAPYIQKYLGLPGFDPVGVDIACDKLLFRKTLQRAGTFGIIHACSLNDYLSDDNAFMNLSQKTTVVLKPTFGSGTFVFLFHVIYTNKRIFFSDIFVYRFNRKRWSFSLLFQRRSNSKTS